MTRNLCFWAVLISFLSTAAGFKRCSIARIPRIPQQSKLRVVFSPESFVEGLQHFGHAFGDFLNSDTFKANEAETIKEIEQVFESAGDALGSVISNDFAAEDAEASALSPLGNDMLIFLCSTIGIVPLFKWLKASPVLGFMSAGLLMGPAGLKLFHDLNDMESIADFGIIFLLFEQGLELTVERLKALSKFAFGMGTLQVLLSTLAFFTFPFVGGVQILEVVFGSNPEFVDITRLDEAVVIGAALSLSSSAFVLKILQEKGQLNTKFGEASLGVLLLQDIAVVPLLVLLPIIESNSGAMSLSDQAVLLGETFAKAILGLSGDKRAQTQTTDP